ncbi:predicted protein [Sclerotinia sclerotiorum 1980 UF-70]|uniref:Uncharacterized protein n=2 Tax=Sclerotinia sclerotiorum (strain ATCC 18683 / 1980 / Ss-1) TaxID=665079 RepID=A7E884_SCLS1|nr:predicted protein [Sclerotinia sclerotiorum 1980 UF-70]APA06059.1 hypothetical protein sscle_01g008290 [Sclerotinia sclerotiorum 1980 UF-70]EDN96586.1 predicted protein [Sclerotinia sclerotiorum 1980 UF-70]
MQHEVGYPNLLAQTNWTVDRAELGFAAAAAVWRALAAELVSGTQSHGGPAHHNTLGIPVPSTPSTLVNT